MKCFNICQSILLCVIKDFNIWREDLRGYIFNICKQIQDLFPIYTWVLKTLYILNQGVNMSLTTALDKYINVLKMSELKSSIKLF